MAWNNCSAIRHTYIQIYQTSHLMYLEIRQISHDKVSRTLTLHKQNIIL